MSSCEMNNWLGRYHDGRLSLAQAEQFERHLADCAVCPSELQQLRLISQTLRSADLPKASPAFIARLEALSENIPDAMVWRFATRLTAAAAAILIAATCQWAMHRSTAPQTVADLAPEERVIIDPESAIPAAAETTTAQADLISFDLSGGNPQ